MTVVAYCFLVSVVILAIAVLVRVWLGNMNRWTVTSTDILYYFMWAAAASMLWPILFIATVIDILTLGQLLLLVCILVAGFWLVAKKGRLYHL